MHITRLMDNQRKGGKLERKVVLLVVVFSKGSACHLGILGVLSWFDLCSLGSHSEIKSEMKSWIPGWVWSP